jgi:hypothetical protein
LSESLSDTKIVISTETTPIKEKIAERKTVVYETLVDTTVIKVTGEKLKDWLFSRFGFIRPRREDIQFVSIDKYYEPYIVISGKYAVDYFRKAAYTVTLDKEVLEVILLNQQFKPEQSTDSYGQLHNVIKLGGEERIKREFTASLILDQSGQEVAPERLPSAPSERDPKKTLAKCGTREIDEDADLNIIRSKILKRPKDISRIVDELFEVNERVVIYTPRFKILYRNTKTNEEKSLEFDGVTAKKIPATANVRRAE